MRKFLVTLFFVKIYAQCWYQSATCSSSGNLGFCGNNTASCCPGGSLVSGLCPGPTNIQCCINPTCSTPKGSGTCKQTSKCDGTPVAGYCTGPADIQCCVSGSPSNGYYGIDVSTNVSVSNFQCMKNSNYDWLIVRAYRSNGQVDGNACSNLNNARSAGIIGRDAYIFPCPTCASNGTAQVTATINNLKNCASASWSGRLWLDIEGTQYWTTTAANQKFFTDMLTGCNGYWCGVYTSKSQWEPIMGTSTAGRNYPLWYARYNDQPNYSDFTAFGGWTQPFAKQYSGDVTVCSTGVDKNWANTRPY